VPYQYILVRDDITNETVPAAVSDTVDFVNGVIERAGGDAR